MSFFSDVKSTENLEEVQDYVSSGYKPLPSGVYDATIKYAYTGEAKSGAKSITFAFDIDGREVTETMYVTNRNKETFYKKEGKNYPLPAFVIANDIARLALKGKQITALNTQEKILELYDYESRGKKKTAVDVFADLMGQKVKLGIKQVKEYKQVKDQSGTYVDSDEIKEHNTIDKVFHATNSKTVNETLAKKETAEFIDEWKAKWENNIDDKTKGKTPKVTSSTSTNQVQDTSIDDDVFGD